MKDGDYVMMAAVPAVALYGVLVLTPMMVVAAVMATAICGLGIWLAAKL